MLSCEKSAPQTWWHSGSCCLHWWWNGSLWKLWIGFLAELEFKLLVRVGYQQITKRKKVQINLWKFPCVGKVERRCQLCLQGSEWWLVPWAERGHCGRLQPFYSEATMRFPMEWWKLKETEITGPYRTLNRSEKWELEKFGDLFPIN